MIRPTATNTGTTFLIRYHSFRTPVPRTLRSFPSLTGGMLNRYLLRMIRQGIHRSYTLPDLQDSLSTTTRNVCLLTFCNELLSAVLRIIWQNDPPAVESILLRTYNLVHFRAIYCYPVPPDPFYAVSSVFPYFLVLLLRPFASMISASLR